MTRPSRRKAAAKVRGKRTSADPVLALCAHYGDLKERRTRLIRRWGRLESRLAKHHDWFKLSRAAQRALPEAQELYAIDDEFERIGKEHARVLHRLRALPAHTLQGAIAKLSVAADVIDPDDYPSAHRLLLGSIKDLFAIARRTGVV